MGAITVGYALVMGVGLPTDADRCAAFAVAGGFGVLCALSAVGACRPQRSGREAM